MAFRPDPKPERRRGNKPRRVTDTTASTRVLLLHPACAACGRRANNSHHVLGRAQGGDDCVANLVGLDGSGSSGCHGAFHGSPYVRSDGVRRDRQWVAARIGHTIATSRPDVAAYVLDKLGDTPGREFLLRVYGLDRFMDQLSLTQVPAGMGRETPWADRPPQLRGAFRWARADAEAALP